MGQQQLLLLVLGVVIVGLAVVVGIQAFSENQKKANADALVNDAVRIASDAQAWKLKPKAFGGGADDPDFSNFDLEQIGYALGGNDCEITEYGNLNGCFTAPGTDSLVITGQNTDLGNQVVVTVSGTGPESIETEVSTITSN